MSMNVVRVLSIFSLIVALGCGENASVMRGKPGGDGGASGAVQPAQGDTAAQEGAQDGTDNGDGTDDLVGEPTGATGSQDDTLDGRDGQDGDDAIADNGDDGQNGDGQDGDGNGRDGSDGDGRDGQDGTTGIADNGANGTSGTSGTGADGAPGARGEKGEKGDKGDPGETRIVEVPAAEPTVVYVRGEKGDPGLTACSRSEVFPMPAMSATSMSSAEMESFIVPLLQTPAGDMLAKLKKRNKRRSDDVPYSIPKLTLGENTPGKKLVHDSLVMLKIPVTLPPKKYIVGASKVYINIRTIKTRGDGKHGDGHDETEFFALLGHDPREMIMSGYRYDEQTQWFWAAAYNNPAYPEAVNRAYSQMMVESIHRQTAGKRSSQPVEITVAVDLNQIIAGSFYKDALDYLYRNVTDTTKPANVDLNIAVGDDTKVIDAKIEMTFLKDTCAEAEDQQK